LSNKVSIITVVLNDKIGLEKTIHSVLEQTFKDYEHVVIDGKSTDGTLDVIRLYKENISKTLSEQDMGVYDAMNRGIKLSTAEWLIFLNAGDVFYSKTSLESAGALIENNIDVIYSDAYYRGSRNFLFKCDSSKMRVVHQSVLYRKSLHDINPGYLVGNGVTISDYIFFNSIKDASWRKCNDIIACCDGSGLSSHTKHFHQKMCVDLLFGRRNKYSVLIILLLHPIYWKLKRLFS